MSRCTVSLSTRIIGMRKEMGKYDRVKVAQPNPVRVSRDSISNRGFRRESRWNLKDGHLYLGFMALQFPILKCQPVPCGDNQRTHVDNKSFTIWIVDRAWNDISSIVISTVLSVHSSK